MLLSPSTLAIVAILQRLAFAQITLAPRQANALAAEVACSSVEAILLLCAEQSPGFDLLPSQSQASCACSSAVGFDDNVSTCLAFISGQPAYALAYSTAAPYESLCVSNTGVGSFATVTAVSSPGAAVSTTFATSSSAAAFTTNAFTPEETTSSSGKGSGTYYPATKSKGLKGGAKAGAAIGGVLGGLALLVIGFFAARFKNGKKAEEPSPSTVGAIPDEKAGGNPNMMGGNPNMMGQNPNMMGQNPNMMGQNPNMMVQNPNMTGHGVPTYTPGVQPGPEAGAEGIAEAAAKGPVSPLTTELSGTSTLKPSEMTATTVTPVYELGTNPPPPPSGP